MSKLSQLLVTELRVCTWVGLQQAQVLAGQGVGHVDLPGLQRGQAAFWSLKSMISSSSA
jgi:hypothetical protein